MRNSEFRIPNWPFNVVVQKEFLFVSPVICTRARRETYGAPNDSQSDNRDKRPERRKLVATGAMVIVIPIRRLPVRGKTDEQLNYLKFGIRNSEFRIS